MSPQLYRIQPAMNEKRGRYYFNLGFPSICPAERVVSLCESRDPALSL
jgi:hypothetical protein